MPQRRYEPGNGRENPRWQGESFLLPIALTAMVSGIRKPQTIGFEMLSLGRILKTFFCLIAATSILNFPLFTWLVGNQIAKGDDWSLRLFALAFLAVSLWMRHQRRQEKWDPSRPHRLDPGISWFTFLPIREDYVYRFVDPGVVFLAGAIIRMQIGWPLLGLYLMVAAGALAAFEWSLHQQTEQHEWQLGDAPKDAARDAEAMKAMAGQGAKPAQESAVPTGMDENLAADIARRQRERGGEAAHDLG